MIILKKDQIQAWENYTKARGISALDLMENAASAAVEKIDLILGDEDQEVLILCGNGNNGADGLAIARILSEMEYLVDVYVNLEGNHSPEWKVNYEKLVSADPEHLVIHTNWDPDSFELSPSGTIIDAMFGIGLSRPLSGVWLEITNWVNEQDNVTIAIDIPSGMYVDSPPDGEVVYADLIITFQSQKLAFMMPECETYFGEIIIVPIGLIDTYLIDHQIKTFELSHFYLAPFVNLRSRFSHKGDFGHALLIAGSTGKAGAAVLAAGGAMRSGIGTLTLQVPERLYSIVQTAIPEAMVVLDSEMDVFSGVQFQGKITAMGIGPGLGQDEKTIKGIETLIEKEIPVPILIDADGLNIISKNIKLLDKLPPGSIITPHPLEFDRIFGEHEDHFSRYQTAIKEAVKRKIHIVLKGGITIVCQTNGVSFFNNRGNPGMATAGSGDVLAGIITGLLAQGYPSDVAALMGVYLHSTAGDLAADEIGVEAMIAGDIIEFLGEAYDTLKQIETQTDSIQDEDA